MREANKACGGLGMVISLRELVLLPILIFDTFTCILCLLCVATLVNFALL